MSLVPLQINSSYTLLNSTITINRLVQHAKEMGYTALALTDKNVMYGAVEFYKSCISANIKPIIGLELEVSGFYKEENDSILLYAKNLAGYQQLIKLSTKKMTLDEKVNLTAKDFQDIVGHQNENIIGIIPTQNSELSDLLENNENEKVHTILSTWKKCFSSDHLFLGTPHSLSENNNWQELQKMTQENNLHWAAIDPIKILDSKEEFSLRVLEAIGRGEKLEESLAFSKPKPLLNKQIQESKYVDLFGKEAVKNTEEIADKINFDMTFHQSLLPKYAVPNGTSTEDYLQMKCEEGLQKRLPGYSTAYHERLMHELSVINKMGFADYFLIVWDIMAFAHKKNILTGAGRGSAAGSLVSFALSITDVDPIKYNLLFERFLNEERKNMPDIDLDFPDNRREEILEYTKNKYGLFHAAQIATFGTLAAKMAIRDTARVMGYSQEEMSSWSKAISSEPGITLRKAYKQSKALQELVNQNDKNKQLFHTAVNIEGLPRHVGTHAAGVVISDRALVDIVPLQSGNGVLNLTQYTMGAIEEIGLLKMDFLGLKNLSILSEAVQLIQTNVNRDFSIHTMAENDAKTIEIFRNSDTLGIFQFESDGIKRALRQVSPQSLEDIASVNALYRPGPMEQIKLFSDRKNNNETISYLHEDLKPILENTYGVMIYQEQVMLVAAKMAGYSLGQADILRRAMSKKEKDAIDQERIHFVEGASKKGYSRNVADKMYDFIARFANYGFNRSHAVAYSMIAYQMAFVKAHYPTIFYTAVLNASQGNQGKIQEYLQEVKKKKIQLLPIDINQSMKGFSYEDNQIRLGFQTIKGLRRDFVQHILYERRQVGNFQTFIDFIRKIDSRWRKKEWIEPLILTGSFDQLGENRATLLASTETILSSIDFSGDNVQLLQALEPRYEKQEEFPLDKRLDDEFSYTGLYLSGHPTDFYPNLREKRRIVHLKELNKNKSANVLVMIKDVRKIKTKNGEPMAFVECQDGSGNGTLVVFPVAYRKVGSLLEKGKIVLVSGKAEDLQPETKIIVNQMDAIEGDEMENPPQEKTDSSKLFLRISTDKNAAEMIDKINDVVHENAGAHVVIIYDEKTKRKIQLKSTVTLNTGIITFLKDLLGEKDVVIQ